MDDTPRLPLSLRALYRRRRALLSSAVHSLLCVSSSDLSLNPSRGDVLSSLKVMRSSDGDMTSGGTSTHLGLDFD